jgi:glycine/D-amino acid oxidase-like deaminating enzyme
MVRVGVVGAGVIGLSTALCIKLQHPTVSLTITADRFLDATTSDGAGGLFRPDDRFIPGVDKSTLRYDVIMGHKNELWTINELIT